MTDAQKPVAWYVYVASHQTAYAVIDEDDAQLMDDATNHDAEITPLFDHPADDESLQVAGLMLSQAQARVKELEVALREGIRAIGEHSAPDDCYATGPMTGDPIRDLVQCPACTFLNVARAALSQPAALQQITDIGQLQAEPAPRLTDAEIFSVIRPLYQSDWLAEQAIAISMDEYRAIEAKVMGTP